MRVLLLALTLSLFSAPVAGQSIWTKPYEPNQVAVETIIPDAAPDESALSGATFVSATASLSENVELGAELPVAQYRPSSGASTSALGNPFVGLGMSSTNVPVLVQVGLRIPVAPANRATSFGMASDIGRTTAFQPEAVSFSTLFNGRRDLGRTASLRVRTGIEFSSRPPQTSGAETRIQSWRLYYDAQLWRDGDRVLTGLSFTGRALLNSPGLTSHNVALSFMGNWNRIQPGLLVGTSVNDLFLRGELTPFVGLTLSISYGRF